MQPTATSAPYEPRNLLDRLSNEATLDSYYQHVQQREQALLARLAIQSGDVLSVGSGFHPGRHLFPAPQFRLVGVDSDPQRVEALRSSGAADEALVGEAGQLDLAAASFDVVLYRLVLHHIAFQGPLSPCFEEAARLVRPGGVLVAVEPGLWHPVGAALAIANRLGVATAIHGTPDDVPLSPRLLLQSARAAGLEPELAAVTYLWRRMPRWLQRVLRPLDSLGSRPRPAVLGHTLMLVARKR
jgi:SAM-dependent methyltransferase